MSSSEYFLVVFLKVPLLPRCRCPLPPRNRNPSHDWMHCPVSSAARFYNFRFRPSRFSWKKQVQGVYVLESLDQTKQYCSTLSSHQTGPHPSLWDTLIYHLPLQM